MPGIDKNQVVSILRDIAFLLEFRGENPFKARAFENASRALLNDPASLDELVSEPGRLEGLKGIGKSTAEIIRESVESGTSALLVELRSEAPGGILDLQKIPNLASAKIRVLVDNLGISGIDDLEAACKSGIVETLPGFGRKSVENLLAGIEQVRSSSGQWLYSKALAIALPILNSLRTHPQVGKAEVAGSLRRCNEIVRDLDFVASSKQPRAVMDFFVALPAVDKVIGSGDTKTSVLLSGGIQSDLRVVSEMDFPAALQYFTGSREHNTAIRGRAKRMGLRVNEYGVFQVGDTRSHATAFSGERIAIKDERDFYEVLGLGYIPPELREDLGEIEAAEHDTLPDLAALLDYLGVLHCHTTWSDGTCSIRELALAARDQWHLKYLAICDHSEAAAYAGGMKRDAVARQHDEIDRLNAEFEESHFRILKGCECDILADGSLDYPEEVLGKMELVVASVHTRFQMSREEMTTRLLRAIENPYTDILGHVSGRLLLARNAYALDIVQVLERAAQCGTVIEINGDPQRLDLDWRLCRQAKALGIRFAVNPDAHSVAGLQHIVYGMNVARKGWLTRGDIVNCLPLRTLQKEIARIRSGKLA
jgi:DNA polymerase (family 10)